MSSAVVSPPHRFSLRRTPPLHASTPRLPPHASTARLRPYASAARLRHTPPPHSQHGSLSRYASAPQLHAPLLLSSLLSLLSCMASPAHGTRRQHNHARASLSRSRALSLALALSLSVSLSPSSPPLPPHAITSSVCSPYVSALATPPPYPNWRGQARSRCPSRATPRGPRTAMCTHSHAATNQQNKKGSHTPHTRTTHTHARARAHTHTHTHTCACPLVSAIVL